ncbi:FHA domain-containing protein [Novosphingobium soli]|uniref:FHA domain-containing protein n=1 Tax=Novosphingobium soli TaxID=574956 RepID=A0ABV6D1Y7_9SPHN
MAVILALCNRHGQPAQPAPLRIERGEVVIGRGAGAHLLIAEPTVSRRHCTVSGDGLDWRIVDASSGGTFVNGQRIAGAQALRHGDVIRVGESEVAVALEQAQGLSGPAPGASPRDGWGRLKPASTQIPGDWTAPGTPPAPAAAPGDPDAAGALLRALGLSRGQVAAPDAQVAATAGAVLQAALAGLLRLAQDRRKARADLGTAAGPAAPALPGSAEELLLALLSAPPADATAQVSALCAELDAHQRAVLGAMQAGLHHALDQFSPASIKNKARGDAEAWKVYERAFEDRDGFVEIFAQALSTRYAEAVGT